MNTDIMETALFTLSRQIDQMMAEEALPTLYRQVDQAIEEALNQVQTLQQSPYKQIACRGKGCNWCCYDFAFVSKVEFLGLVYAYRRLSPAQQRRTRRRLKAWASAHGWLNHPIVFFADQEIEQLCPDMIRQIVASSAKAGTPCMFLENGNCLVYAYRPLVCRGHHSLADDPAECQKRLNGLTATPSLNLIPLLHSVSQQLKEQHLYFPAGELHSMFLAIGESNELELV